MNRFGLTYSVLLIGAFFMVPAVGMGGTVLLEAEQFEDHGGWVADQQFMDQMGSPYLLAHGLGVPVADATTRVKFAEAGRYKVWVRTRDWVAPWGAKDGPGRFEIIVGGRKLSKIFGTEGAKWHWQEGGTVQVPKGQVTVGLHDLTGFEGRCDAILFSSDLSFVPPNADPEMKVWRRALLGLGDEPSDGGRYDLVVVGGGIAGTCASLNAARLGLTVALIQDRPVLGGNNSSEVRVWLGGNTNYDPYPRIGDVVGELEPTRKAHYGPDNTADLYEDQRRIDLVRAEKNISLFLRHRANEVETSGDEITAVIAQDTISGRRRRFAGRYFADCTGDGCIGALAGADFDMTLDGHMGRCNLWNAADTGAPAAFPRCPWAIDLSDKPFPTGLKQLGAWFWESGFFLDPIEKSEYIRDLNFRAMYGAWDALKNVRRMYPNHRLNWAAYISGKRESRRLLGDIVLTKEDVVEGVYYEDGCVPATWSIDLHLPDPAYDKRIDKGEEFLSKAYYTNYSKPYWVPYRCLYSRNIGNLFMAGRDISVTHEALGAVRVMRTCGMMGEIVGMAAFICKEHSVEPRAVYADYLDELTALMAKGVAVGWLADAGPNLARSAKVAVQGSYDENKYPKKNINDGRFNKSDNNLRWLSNASESPHYVEFSWNEPQTIGAMRVVSGYFQGQAADDPIGDFSLQYRDGDGWRDVEGSRVMGNRRVEAGRKFDAFESDKVRLVITSTPGGISRIWEVEFYGPGRSGR